MLSKLLCGAILVSAAAGAPAQTWDFTYTGFNFLDVYAEQPGLTTHFVPDAAISGSFSGTDRNGDGVLSADELTGPTNSRPALWNSTASTAGSPVSSPPGYGPTRPR